MAKPHTFEASTGEVFEFDTEDEMDDFALRWTIGNLVKNGLGELVTIDGEEAFQINEKGIQWLKDQEEQSVQ